MADVKLDFTSDNQRLQKAIEDNIKSMERLKQVSKGLAKDSKQDTEEQISGLDKLVTGVGNWAAGFLSVAGAMKIVGGEMQNILDLQRKAAEAAKTEADTQRDFLRNLGAKNEAQRDSAIAKVDEMSKATGVSRKDLYQRASAIFSARGNLTDEQAWSAVEKSSKFIPENQEAGRALGVSLMDIMRSTKDPNAGNAAGLVAATAGNAHISNWEQISKTVAPALGNAMQSGATAGEASALFSALTLGMNDWTGEKSKTATSTLAKQLEDFLPEKDRTLYGESGDIKDVRKGTGLTTLGQRLARLQANPQLAEQFYQGGNFGEASPQIRSLLGLTGAEDKEGVKAMYADALAKIPTGAAAGSYFAQQSELIGGTPLQKVGDAARRLKATKDRLQADPARAYAGVLQTEIPDILQASGESGLGQSVYKLGQGLAAGSPDATAGVQLTIGTIERKIDERLSTTQSKPGYMGIPTTGTREVTPGDVKAADNLKDVLAVLKEIHTTLQSTDRKKNVSGAAATNTHTE